MLKVLVCILAICYFTDSAQLRARLPTYVEQCSQSSTTMNQCFVKSANKVIPRLVYGDVHYNIPYMLPLRLNEVVIGNNYNLSFVLRNVEVYGLETTRLTDANLNWLINKYEINLYNPRLIILGDYELNGKILDEPVAGNGKANITLVNGHYSYSATFVSNEGYGKLLNARVQYKTERNIYHFDNLFNGNEFRGYQTGVFLNNNWKAVSQSFQPRAANAISRFLTSVHQGIGDIVPLNEAFLP